jgi:hypothetical protein
LKPNLNLELETLEKRIRKRIRKSREKEKEKAAHQPSSTQPGRAPACPRHLTGGIHLSAAAFSPAHSLSRSLPAGADLSAPVFPLRTSLPSLPHWPVLPGAEPLHPCAPFLSLCAMDPPSQFRPPRTRRGPTRAHSRMTLEFSATTPTHAPQLPLRAPLAPALTSPPHFAQLRPLSCSSHAARRRRRPAPAFPTI